MAIRSPNEQAADEGGTIVAGQPIASDTNQQRPVTVDPPVLRQDSVVEEHVVRTSAGGWSLARGWIRSLGAVILVTLAAVETLLAMRLAFLLADANPSNGFVNFIYDITRPLVEPFQGIVSNSGNLEYASVIAMAVYAVAALLLIAALFALTAGPSTPSEQVVSSRTQQSGRDIR